MRRADGEESEEKDDEDQDSPDSERCLALSRYMCSCLHKRLNELYILLCRGRLLTCFCWRVRPYCVQQQLGYVALNQNGVLLAWFIHPEDARMSNPCNLELDRHWQMRISVYMKALRNSRRE